MKQFIFSFLMLLCAVFSYGQAFPIIENKPVTTLLYTGDATGSISYADPIPQQAYDMGTMRLRLESPKPVIIETKCKPIDEAGNAKYKCLVGEGFVTEFAGTSVTKRDYDRTWQSEDCNTTIYYKGDTAVAMSDEISCQISVFDARYADGCTVYANWFTGYKMIAE